MGYGLNDWGMDSN